MAALNSAFCVLYVFLVYSRLPEILPGGVSITIFALACFTTLVTGHVHKIGTTRLGLLFLVFTALLMISVPLSVWSGGSMAFLKEHWLRSFLLFFLIVAGASSPKRSIRLLMMLPLGVTFVAVQALYVGETYIDNRLVSPNPDGRFSNPNNLAFAVVLAMPLWMTAIVDSTRSVIVRLAGVGSIGVLSVAAIRTGSRAGVLAMCAMAAFVVWRAPMASKVRSLLLAAILIPVGVTMLPQHLLLRFTTFTESTRRSDASLRATTSASHRIHMVEQAVALTLRNPVFGSGVGMFAIAEHDLAREQGKDLGSWADAHNIYAQVASECGIPALLVFLAIPWTAAKLLREAEKGARAVGSVRLAAAASFLQVALVGYCVLGFFGNFAYRDYLPVLCGLTVGIYESVRAHLHVTEKNRDEEDAEASTELRPPVPALRPA